MNWYRAHFPLTSESKIVLETTGRPLITGEASPTYLFAEPAPERVASILPSIKCIVLLRNPVDRAYSSHSLMRKLGKEHAPFEEALQREDEFLQKGKRLQHPAHYYKKRGVYVDQLERWMNYFPPDQILILKSEEFFNNPSLVFDKVLNFLGLPKTSFDNFTRYNAATKSKMNPETRQNLVEYFDPFNTRLNKLVGIDFNWK